MSTLKSIDQLFIVAIFIGLSMFVALMAQVLPGVTGPTFGKLLAIGIVVFGFRYAFPAHAKIMLLSRVSARPFLSARVLFVCAFPALLVMLIVMSWPGVQFARISGAPQEFAFLAIYVGMLHGVFVEEIVFRGLLLPYLLQKYSVHIAVLLQAIPFCLIHYLPLWANLSISNAPFYLALGIFFGYISVFTRSLWPALLAHGLWNAFAYLLLWYKPLMMRNDVLHPLKAELSWVQLLALGLAIGAVFLMLRKDQT